MHCWRHCPTRIAQAAVLLIATGAWLSPTSAQAQVDPPALAPHAVSAGFASATTISFTEAAADTTGATTQLVTLGQSASEAATPAPSPWWSALIIPCMAAWVIRRHGPWARARRTNEDDDEAPTGWSISRFVQPHRNAASGWRLSRFEELPETEPLGLYSSLDDPYPVQPTNVVPLRPPAARSADRPDHKWNQTLDVVDVEARMVRTPKHGAWAHPTENGLNG